MSYLPSRKVAARLGLHPQSPRRYAVKGKYPSTGTPEDSASTTSTPSSKERQTPKQSATAESAWPNNAETSSGKSHTCGSSSQKSKSSLTLREDSTGNGRDSSPYWSDYTAEISSRLWLPTGTDSPNSGLNSSSGWPSKTAAQSWFSTSLMPAPDPNSPRIYSPSSMLSVAACTDSAGTREQSLRIRLYPTTQQKLTIRTWLDASRWSYNLTVEILKGGIPSAWKHIAKVVMSEIQLLHPEWESGALSGETDSGARRLLDHEQSEKGQQGVGQGQGRKDGGGFRRAAFPQPEESQASCYIPDDAVTEHGVYHTILDLLRMAEALPAGQREGRLVRERGQYWLAVPHPAQCDIETPCGDGIVALAPGVRTFLTFFSETDCGKIGYRAFGRIQRLCHWRDGLIGRTAAEPSSQRRRRMRRAQERLRQKIVNLVDELHCQAARWLTSNYKLILLPTFEAQDMTRRAGRRIRSKTARMMLNFRHYEFKQRLKWKAWQREPWCWRSTRLTPARPGAGKAASRRTWPAVQ